MPRIARLTPPSRGPTTLATPQVAPINPPYFPRLVVINAFVISFFEQYSLLQRNDITNCDVDLAVHYRSDGKDKCKKNAMHTPIALSHHHRSLGQPCK